MRLRSCGKALGWRATQTNILKAAKRERADRLQPYLRSVNHDHASASVISALTGCGRSGALASMREVSSADLRDSDAS